ncbi:MAG: aminoacyl-tRNA hydrolase [Nitrospirae bacterium]|nr:aminoacyl-tRNA hydrolase [Nitrospirota bacterium]MBF0540115.1 aminoacyl-tRNA hydrolase [Nitrospirota bacterium]
MIFIIGLGNPGTRYQLTRHNVGFLVIDQLAVGLGVKLTEKNVSHVGNGNIAETGITLIKPLTFMNLSGQVIKVYKNSINAPTDLIVIQDDIDIETGRLKIKQGGSSGGHKGVQSIIDTLGSRDFIRVKIGVGRDINMPVEEYVLRKFSKVEKIIIDETIVTASDAVISIITNGLEITMNKFN